jgi:hypothetical protein
VFEIPKRIDLEKFDNREVIKKVGKDEGLPVAALYLAVPETEFSYVCTIVILSNGP